MKEFAISGISFMPQLWKPKKNLDRLLLDESRHSADDSTPPFPEGSYLPAVRALRSESLQLDARSDYLNSSSNSEALLRCAADAVGDCDNGVDAGRQTADQPADSAGILHVRVIVQVQKDGGSRSPHGAGQSRAGHASVIQMCMQDIRILGRQGLPNRQRPV